MIRSFIALCIIVSSLSSSLLLQGVGCIVGKIQFPHTVQQVPSMRVYYCGKKIDFYWCEVDNSAKQFSYQIPYQLGQTVFHLLIVNDHPEWVAINSKYNEENNTIDYLKIPANKPHRRFVCTLPHDAVGKKNSQWTVREEPLPANGHITEVATTIIICYPPALVEKVVGNTALELPTIVLKEDILQMVGSEKLLHELSNQMILSCLDSDAIHASVQQKVKQVNHVTIVAPVT